MNLEARRGYVVGGLIFLILAVYSLLIAYQLTTHTVGDLPDRLVAWRRRNPWSGFWYIP